MNQSLQKLSEIASKKERTILGLMSGTSADGLDISLTRITGSGFDTSVKQIEFSSVQYTEDFKSEFQNNLFGEALPLLLMMRMQQKVQKEWVRLITNQLNDWEVLPDDIDLIASHGQTVLHSPSTKKISASTMQIVDGDYLAENLGVITLSDFRQKHIAAGFEGAPLAPLAEQLIFSGVEKPVMMLNLGGIANFTLLEEEKISPSLPFSTDAGPANTLIDTAVRKYFKDDIYDRSGEFAAKGKTDANLLEMLKKHPFYSFDAPKSTGPEEFTSDWLESEIKRSKFNGSPEDLISTLTEFSAWGIASEIKKKIGKSSLDIYVSGGGWHNHTLMLNLKKELPNCRFRSTKKLGIDPDAKEAILFSVLANETVVGEGFEYKSKNGKLKKLTLGKISLP